jgi:hypothetical protein
MAKRDHMAATAAAIADSYARIGLKLYGTLKRVQGDLCYSLLSEATRTEISETLKTIEGGRS